MSEVVVYRKRRWVELAMILLAQAIGLAGYLLTNLNLHQKLPDNWIVAGLAWLAIGLAAHLVVRIRIPYADPVILPVVLLLNGLGIAMIHRLDQATDPIMHSAELQMVWTAVAVTVFALVVVFLRDHRRLQRFTYVSFLLGMFVLMMPLLPIIGKERYGAQIWISIGPYNFQPAELAKIILSIAFASYLVEKREVLALAGKRFLGIDLPRARDLGPIAIMWLASLAVLVFQKDLGTSLLFFGLFVMMLYVATERPSWAILGTGLFFGGAALGYAMFSHVRVRFSSWLDPFSDFDQNYQVIVAQFGLAWGGLFGTGWGQGRPGLTPLAKNDMIAAAIGEELGLVGFVALILLYALIVSRGLRTALAATEPFGKLLAAGLSFVFCLQVFAIIGGVTRLLPLTGLTTPFMSQGGSSQIANWTMLAILLVISHQVRKPVVAAAAAGPVASLAEDRTQVIAAVGVSAATPSAPPTPGSASAFPTPQTPSVPETPAEAGEPTALVPHLNQPGDDDAGFADAFDEDTRIDKPLGGDR